MQAELLASLSDPARLAPPLVRSFDAVFGTHPAAQGRAAGAAPKPRGRTKSATDTSASSTVRGGETAMFASAAERTASATECLARLVQTVHDFSKTLPPPPPQQPSSAVPGAPPRAPGGSSASSASAGVRTQQTVRRAVSTGQLRASAAPPDTAAAPAAELAASRPSSRPLSAAQQGRRLAKTASSANLRETSASATRKRDAADAASKASDPASPQRQAEFLDSALAIARTLFAAIELGLSPWHTESLQLEKLACNLVTRLMDCRAHAHAFEVMQYAFGRLGMYRPAPAAPKKSARGRSTSVGSRSARPVSRSSSVSSVRSAGSASESAVSGPASAAASAAALTPEAAALQGRIAAVLGWIASCPIDSSASLLLLQVALLLHINALRWVLVCKPNAGHDEALLKALLSNFGITGLCEQLREIDPKMAGGQCDCIFRILYTHASKQDFHTARYLYVAAVYFYVGSSGFTVKGLHALIQRPLLTKDKTLISGPANVIESYYHRIARLPALEQHFDLDCITWIDHAVQVSRQFPDLRPFWDDFSDRMLERGQEAMPACADALGYLRDCRALHVQLHTAISDPESDVEPGMLDALPTPASGFEFPRRLQLAVLSSLSLLREQLDLDHATLSAKAAAASSHPRARLAPLLSAAAVHVISTAEPFVTQMDADARARAARHVLDMMLLPPLYVAAFDITLPPELGALDQQLALAVEFGKRLGVESYARIIANGAYQSGALLLKRMRVADALPLIKMSVDLVPEAAVSADSGDSTVDARLHHCKRLDVLSFCQEEAGMHEDALDSVIAALRVFPLAAARSEGDGKSAALFEKLVGKHAHLSSMSSRAYNPVLAMLAQGECDSPATVEFVLDLELQMLAAAGMRGDAKLASLEHAAGHFEKSGNPLARARMLLDRARLLRQRHAGEACRVDENGDGSMAATPSMTLGDEARLELAMAHCELGISLNETGDFDPKPFHTALGMWKRALAHVPSFSLPLKKVPGLHKGMDAASAERLFDYIEMLCGYFGVLNQPINTLYCLRLLFKLVQLCPSKTLVDVLELYRDMAATYLALGCTGKAGVMFSLGKQLAESPKCTDAARQAFMSRYALFLASIGNLDKSSQAAAQADVLATDAGGVVTDDNEVLRRAQACLDKSFLSFSAAKLAQAVTEATVAYALLARLSRRAQARRGRGKAPTSAARAPKFACNFSATMMASCLWLGQVHGFQGSFMQAEAYLAKGLEAAQSQRSDGRIAEFAIALADLWARRLEVATAESYVATAARHAPKVAAQLPPHVAAGVRVAEADLQC
ncbi:Separin, partial [Polyrhizophydium stewartii]